MTNTSLEQAFATTEAAAETARRSAAVVVSRARALEKAARTGNLKGIKRCQENLETAVSDLQREVENAGSSWSLADEEVDRIFREDYADILMRTAEQQGVTISQQDDRLLSYPSIVRILHGDLAVRVDRKKVSTVRPTFLVELLLQNQRRFEARKGGDSYSTRFLESLYSVYGELLKESTSKLALSESGRVIPLIRIYRLVTALPGGAREYDRSDFARDLFRIDSDGPKETKNGAKVAFPSSTGTRHRASDRFSFIDPDGQAVEYHGIRFIENQP